MKMLSTIVFNAHSEMNCKQAASLLICGALVLKMSIFCPKMSPCRFEEVSTAWGGLPRECCVC